MARDEEEAMMIDIHAFARKKGKKLEIEKAALFLSLSLLLLLCFMHYPQFFSVVVVVVAADADESYLT